MAKQKEIAKPKTVLTKPREVFRKELLNRIELGENIYNRQIQNNEEFSKLKRDAYNWNDYNEELIKQSFNNQYGEYFYEYSRLNQLAGLYDHALGVNTESQEYKLNLSKEKIDNCINWLNQFIEKLPLIEEDSSIVSFASDKKTFINRGFIVHGHNQERKYEVARFIENDLRRKAIILHEQANKGKTIIEKFESYSSVDFAIALWTSDDIGKGKDENDLHTRARQNVIFETGFFIGKLGRQNVIVLYEKGVEIPSDYSGIIFIPLSNNWKDDLRKEIDAIYEM